MTTKSQEVTVSGCGLRCLSSKVSGPNHRQEVEQHAHKRHAYIDVSFHNTLMCSHNEIYATRFHNKKVVFFPTLPLCSFYLLLFISSPSERRTTDGHQLMLHGEWKNMEGWMDGWKGELC